MGADATAVVAPVTPDKSRSNCSPTMIRLTLSILFFSAISFTVVLTLAFGAMFSAILFNVSPDCTVYVESAETLFSEASDNAAPKANAKTAGLIKFFVLDLKIMIPLSWLSAFFIYKIYYSSAILQTCY